MQRIVLAIAWMLLFTAITQAATTKLTIQLPDGKVPQKATAQTGEVKTLKEIKGTTTGQVVTFTNLASETPYNIQITLADGTVLQGVNLDWYSEEPADPKAGPLTADDRTEIQGILNLPSFYNKVEILSLRGNHDQVTALVQLMRTSDFHSKKGNEVIWRVELYYFKFQAGGWEKVGSVNRILRRERMDADALNKIMTHLKWIPELGGITFSANETQKTLTLPANVGQSPKPAPTEETTETTEK